MLKSKVMRNRPNQRITEATKTTRDVTATVWQCTLDLEHAIGLMDEFQWRNLTHIGDVFVSLWAGEPS